MKIINVTVKIAENEKTFSEETVAPLIHHCGECEFFYRHYIHDAHRGYQALFCGHCVPPKTRYARKQNHNINDMACCYFIPKI